jgi:transcriptional regulator with XRE-family HTH domain
MPPTTSPTIEVNGYTLRVIRVLTGIDALPFSEAIGVDRSYLNKLENGHKSRVSPGVFDAMCRTLAVQDKRALMANPHGLAEADAA